MVTRSLVHIFQCLFIHFLKIFFRAFWAWFDLSKKESLVIICCNKDYKNTDLTLGKIHAYFIKNMLFLHLVERRKLLKDKLLKYSMHFSCYTSSRALNKYVKTIGREKSNLEF